VTFSETRFCPFCTQSVKPRSEKCHYCGEFLTGRMCLFCAQTLSSTAKKCHSCGAVAPLPSKKSQAYLTHKPQASPRPQVQLSPPNQSQAPPGKKPPVSHFVDVEFVLIAPGRFLRGSPDAEAGREVGEVDESQHEVVLTQAFYLQTTPVTQAQWQAVMGDNPSSFQGADLPVETIRWLDCQRFIKKLNQAGTERYRLPTEAEWEYACRAGTDTPFAVGNGYDLDSSQANFDGNSPYGLGHIEIYREATTPVKSFAPNAWGLYDMHGNVWEWCQDWCADYPRSSLTNPEGPALGVERVIRGGSWFNDAQGCRSAVRFSEKPDHSNHRLGFRLVRLV
jgi:sulfatase modifying factor 1